MVLRPKHNNRLKELIVPYTDVLNNMNVHRYVHKVVCKKALPANCEVVSVHNDPCMGGFSFIIHCEEFDVVEQGTKIPSFDYDRIELIMRMERVE